MLQVPLPRQPLLLPLPSSTSTTRPPLGRVGFLFDDETYYMFGRCFLSFLPLFHRSRDPPSLTTTPPAPPAQHHLQSLFGWASGLPLRRRNILYVSSLFSVFPTPSPPCYRSPLPDNYSSCPYPPTPPPLAIRLGEWAPPSTTNLLGGFVIISDASDAPLPSPTAMEAAPPRHLLLLPPPTNTPPLLFPPG